MSLSPVAEQDLAAARDSESNYRRSLAHLNQLLDHGGTLSGREANCAFLNTQGRPFATVSAVVGFDFLDDGRAVAHSDWDHDGDQDLWVTNRTGPRLRFLRNDTPSSYHFLGLRLVGRSCNRDAIGARVEVVTADRPGETLLKSLRAGEGFLSQSSKWLHFGLGTATRIERLRVRWPGGETQEFRDLEADHHYVLTQGQAAVVNWQRPAAVLAITPQEQVVEPASERARVLLSQRLPLPRLTAPLLSDPAQSVALAEPGTPTLINLWASWCGPCLQELQQLSEHEQQLRAAGLAVVTVCVDGVTPSGEPSGLSPQQLVAQLKLPFTATRATRELIEQLQIIQRLPFATHVELPVPVSFLVDDKQQLAILYRGQVEVDQVLADVGKLSLSGDAWAVAARPSLGRWNEPPALGSQLAVATQLMNRGDVEEALDYVIRHQTTLSADPEFPTLLVWLGDQLITRGQPQRALDQYRAALTVDPAHLIAMNNLAWQRATHPEAAVRDGADAVRWAERAARQTQTQDAGILDTLAAAYAEAGRFEDATKVMRQALKLAEQAGLPELVPRFNQRAELYRQRQPYRQPVGN